MANNTLHDIEYLKILTLLDKVTILTSKRIAEILNISRDGSKVERKMEYLQKQNLIRVTGKSGVGKMTNLWELTEAGKTFVARARKKNKLPIIKLSEMNEDVKEICCQILNILELPKSNDELEINLKASGIKLRKNKLGDLLRVLEAAQIIEKNQVRKEIKILERIDLIDISDIPGGIVTYVKIEGSDIYSAEIY